MNLPPKDSYDSIILFWFENYMETYALQSLVGSRTEKALKEYVVKGFSREEHFDYCAVTFWKDGTQLELWEQIELRVEHVQ